MVNKTLIISLKNREFLRKNGISYIFVTWCFCAFFRDFSLCVVVYTPQSASDFKCLTSFLGEKLFNNSLTFMPVCLHT